MIKDKTTEERRRLGITSANHPSRQLNFQALFHTLLHPVCGITGEGTQAGQFSADKHVYNMRKNTTEAKKK